MLDVTFYYFKEDAVARSFWRKKKPKISSWDLAPTNMSLAGPLGVRVAELSELLRHNKHAFEPIVFQGKPLIGMQLHGVHTDTKGPDYNVDVGLSANDNLLVSARSGNQLTRYILYTNGEISKLDNEVVWEYDHNSNEGFLIRKILSWGIQVAKSEILDYTRRQDKRRIAAAVVASVLTVVAIAYGVFVGVTTHINNTEAAIAAAYTEYDAGRHQLPGQGISAPKATVGVVAEEQFALIPQRTNADDSLRNPRRVILDRITNTKGSACIEVPRLHDDQAIRVALSQSSADTLAAAIPQVSYGDNGIQVVCLVGPAVAGYKEVKIEVAVQIIAS